MKSSKQRALEDEIGDKNLLDIDHESEDISTLTVKCYLKENVEEFMIAKTERSTLLVQALMIQGIVLTMLLCMCYGIYINENNDAYEFSHTFTVFFVKVPCTIALHLLLYPEVVVGMNIMKFANQNHEKFVENGSEIAFVLGFL